MCAKQIWNDYLQHRNLDQLREDLLTDPWFEHPANANESLLMSAVQSRDPDAVQILISLGESPNLPATDGFSFLHQAVDGVSDAKSELDRITALAVLTALLDAGADPNVQGVDGTPLHRAAGTGVLDSARLLLAYGAAIESRTLVDGELTPLMHAALMDKPLMVQFLLDAGANRLAISGSSLTDPPMTIPNLLQKWRGPNADAILRMLASG